MKRLLLFFTVLLLACGTAAQSIKQNDFTTNAAATFLALTNGLAGTNYVINSTNTTDILRATRNLSDVASKPAAATNVGVFPLGATDFPVGGSIAPSYTNQFGMSLNGYIYRANSTTAGDWDGRINILDGSYGDPTHMNFGGHKYFYMNGSTTLGASSLWAQDGNLILANMNVFQSGSGIAMAAVATNGAGVPFVYGPVQAQDLFVQTNAAVIPQGGRSLNAGFRILVQNSPTDLLISEPRQHSLETAGTNGNHYLFGTDFTVGKLHVPLQLPYVWDWKQYGGTLSSLTHSGTTATGTLANHPFVKGETIMITGATGGDSSIYNGNFTVTAQAQNTFTFTLGSTPSGDATGTITCLTTNADLLTLDTLNGLVIMTNGTFALDSGLMRVGTGASGGGGIKPFIKESAYYIDGSLLSPNQKIQGTNLVLNAKNADATGPVTLDLLGGNGSGFNNEGGNHSAFSAVIQGIPFMRFDGNGGSLPNNQIAQTNTVMNGWLQVTGTHTNIGATELDGGLTVTNSPGSTIASFVAGTNGTAAVNSFGNFKTATNGSPTEVNYGTLGNKTNGISMPITNAVAIVNNGVNVVLATNSQVVIANGLTVNGGITNLSRAKWADVAASSIAGTGADQNATNYTLAGGLSISGTTLSSANTTNAGNIWFKNGRISTNVFATNVVTACTGTASEQTLLTNATMIPANTLAAAGDKLNWTVVFTNSSATTTRTYAIYLGTTKIFSNTGGSAGLQSTSVTLEGQTRYMGANTQVTRVTIHDGAYNAFSPKEAIVASAENTGAALGVGITVTTSGGGASDISFEGLDVDYEP